MFQSFFLGFIVAAIVAQSVTTITITQSLLNSISVAGPLLKGNFKIGSALDGFFASPVVSVDTIVEKYLVIIDIYK